MRHESTFKKGPHIFNGATQETLKKAHGGFNEFGLQEAKNLTANVSIQL